ncbi:hypothetical protein [Bacillus sp. T33-2]|uniref:hypothetical protein n=1 Tax=Bacillus sp. T33-2 TaxID=2054168 RepID=UPI000C762A00|nr:hypothetical protein [Bacillus sp. T33-2]PLR97424.1 hypothetical protein CVD19_08010 [Bacillus sp. T33-2]
MESIVPINGKVNYMITLDPGVWIFDDRRVDLNTYFQQIPDKDSSLDEYTKSISRHWDREIMEGAIFPPTLKTERKFEKEKVLTGSFGIPFKPFLENAGPYPEATAVEIITKDGSQVVPLSQAFGMILGFSFEGKPLRGDGPVHAYFEDGSNRDSPIRNITSFTVK